MTTKHQQILQCQICKEQKMPGQVVFGELIRPSVVEAIKNKYTEWTSQGFIMDYFSKRSKFFFISLGFLLLLLVGEMDYLTGTEISCVIFYLLPISLVTWFVGRLTGILLSSASAIIWFIADSMGGAIYQHYLIPYWNAIIETTFLC